MVRGDCTHQHSSSHCAPRCSSCARPGTTHAHHPSPGARGQVGAGAMASRAGVIFCLVLSLLSLIISAIGLAGLQSGEEAYRAAAAGVRRRPRAAAAACAAAPTTHPPPHQRPPTHTPLSTPVCQDFTADFVKRFESRAPPPALDTNSTVAAAVANATSDGFHAFLSAMAQSSTFVTCARQVCWLGGHGLPQRSCLTPPTHMHTIPLHSPPPPPPLAHAPPPIVLAALVGVVPAAGAGHHLRGGAGGAQDGGHADAAAAHRRHAGGVANRDMQPQREPARPQLCPRRPVPVGYSVAG